MLISEAISKAVATTGSVVANSVLVFWLSELDGKLAIEFYRAEGWAPYDPTDDLNTELLVPYPWDGFYVNYLEAMTYYTHGEYDRYPASMEMSETKLAEFRAFMQRTQAKVCGCGFPTDKTGGTYVTVIPEQAESVWYWINAYSLAVMHGFKGTEDEWLASLVGPQGPKGDPYTILGLYATIEDLEEAHPTGEKGDAWAVGDEDENTTYNWDVDAEAWVDIGPLRGPQGETGETGATGAAAGFGTVNATVDGNTGTPGVNVLTSGPDTEKNITFEFVNLKGSTGATGADGADGEDGISPEVTIAEITGGHSVSITDADHPSGQTFNVMDGTDGAPGQDGQDGAPGQDGVSPAVAISSITGGHSVTITDADHPGGQSFNVMDGADGTSFVVKGLYATLADLILAHPTGSAGDAYAVGTSSSNTTYIWDVDENDWTNIGSIQGPPGQDGQDGQDGAPGQDGQDGQDGAPGPNQVTTSTTTNITGLFKGDGSAVSAATAGNDYVAPSDLTDIRATGSTNGTGATISAGRFFYLNNVLVQAKTDIASGATFTNGTNYETPTAGALNALKSATLRFPDYANPEVVTPTTSNQTFSKDGIVVVGSKVFFSSNSNSNYYAAVIGNTSFYINFYDYELNARREQIALPVKKGTTYRYEISGGTLGGNEWAFIPFIT